MHGQSVKQTQARATPLDSSIRSRRIQQPVNSYSKVGSSAGIMAFADADHTTAVWLAEQPLTASRSTKACQRMWASSTQAAWMQVISMQEPSEQYQEVTACLGSSQLLVHSQLQAELGLQAEAHPEGGRLAASEIPDKSDTHCGTKAYTVTHATSPV